MRFHILLNNDDYFAMNEYLQMYSPTGKKQILIGRFLTAIFSVFLFLFVFLMGVRGRLMIIETIVLIVLSVYNFFAYPKTVKKGLRRKVDQVCKTGKLPYDPDSVVDFTEECIFEYSPVSSHRFEYRDIHSIANIDGYIILLFSPIQGIILPLRCLEGREAELMALLNAKRGQQ